jgi:O-antigen/teichoic acid export membrane protein
VSPRTLLRHSFGLALATYVARAVLLARGLVAAVVLGPAGFGTWNALSLVADYGGYASAGALQGLELRLPVAVADGDHARARVQLQGAWAVILAAFAVFALAVGAVLMRGAPALTATAGPGPALLLLAAAGAQLALQVHATALKARGDFPAVSRATALQALLGAGIGLALLSRCGLWGLAGGWLAGTVAALLWLRVAAPEVPLAPAHPREGLALAWAGLPVFGAFLASLVLRSVDRLALVRAGDPSALGLYSLGLTAAGLVLYPPEAVAAVLYPRIAAAAGGARDPERTRAEVVRAHRALTLALPLLVGIGMVCAGPLVRAWLPRFRGGIEALRLLAFGALLLSAATVPGYWLLGRGRAWTLLVASAACAAVTALLVFGVAARAPRPTAVATAACLGYALFAVTLTTLAARDLEHEPGARVTFVAASLLPAAWTGAAAFGLCALGPAGGVGLALARSAALALLHAPLLAWLGHGLGPRELARAWRGEEGA